MEDKKEENKKEEPKIEESPKEAEKAEEKKKEENKKEEDKDSNVLTEKERNAFLDQIAKMELENAKPAHRK